MAAEVPTSVRLPADVRGLLEQACRVSRRSLTAEIVFRLEQSLRRDGAHQVDGVVRDETHTFTPDEAAVAAASAPAAEETGCWDHRGNPKSWCQACKNS